MKIEYKVDDNGDIVLPDTAPFDGKTVLIKVPAGWVEAYWMPSNVTFDHEGNRDDDGFCWNCLDNSYEDQELDNATE